MQFISACSAISVVKILIAPDKFKGSLDSADVAAHIAAGLREALPDAQITTLPVADGGEGTAVVICSAAGGKWQTCSAHDPLGRKIEARYCTIDGGTTAVMEMSEAAGLWRVPEQLRNPEAASSVGVGEMLLDATRRKARHIIIGLGGSATNDGGSGMARALGFRFLDESGVDVGDGLPELLRLARIERPARLQLPAITAAVDVQTPLLGPAGATQMFAVQKGATPRQIETLELALTRLAEVAARDLNEDVRDRPGSGAAGGLGFGLQIYCGASIRSGFDVVVERIGLDAAMREADVVVTGEGRLDAQTLQGKAPAGVARLARELDRPCYAIVGELDDAAEVRQLFERVLVARPAGMSREDALQHASSLLQQCARQLGELLESAPRL